MSFWLPGNSRLQAIAASAGSGKTYRLTHRIIGLLANGVSPDRIIALTFSRKAAGEILDDVMTYLCAGASSEENAANHAANAFCQASRKDFETMLRSMINDLPRIHLQTLDSFTISTVSAFPFELGITGEFEIIDNNEAILSRIRENVLEEMIGQSAAVASGFGKDFKQATIASEDKKVRDTIAEFISQYHDELLQTPSEDLWGNEWSIWPSGLPYAEPPEVERLAGQLVHELESAGITGGIVAPLMKIVNRLAGHRYGMTVKFTTTLESRLLEKLDLLLSGQPVELEYSRKAYILPSQVSSLLGNLFAAVICREYRLALERTQGIYKLINQYEQNYNDVIRRQGKLTFADAQLLLTPSYHHDDMIKLDIDYRLDCRLNHWLLDEFQDTSDMQWEIVDNLISEVIQDPTGERSFFYVGDVKQAIYQWRNGNPKLFDQILAQWPDIERTDLPVCRRQPESVIRTVNKVFGQIAVGTPMAELLPSETVQRWQNTWVDHQPGPGVPDGCTCVIKAEMQGTKGSPKDTYPVVAELISEINPVNRGLSTAILVRSNDRGQEIVDYLREHCPGINVVLEGKSTLNDSMAVNLILSLLRVASHPGDTISWGSIQLSPLWTVISDRHLEAKNTLIRHLNEHLSRYGFQEVIKAWSRDLLTVLGNPEFAGKRLDDLVQAAAAFDRLSDGSIDRFLQYIADYKAAEMGEGDVVRVMTVHQSKGLGFDVVILPELVSGNSRSIAKTQSPSYIVGQNPHWVLKAPTRQLAEVDPRLADAYEHADAETAFENLCVLYVAMTRSKQALYIVKPDMGGESVTYLRLLDTALGTAGLEGGTIPGTIDYLDGSLDWYSGITAPPPTPPATFTTLPDDYRHRPSQRPRFERVSPSAVSDAEKPAVTSLSEVNTAALRLGSIVHGIMEHVEWQGSEFIRQQLQLWLDENPDEPERLRDLVSKHVTAIANSPDIGQLFAKPAGNVVLWCEKSFEIILDKGWISGVFDRVVIEYDDLGLADRATIIDYKTDNLSHSTIEERWEHHRPQLEMYRRVLAQMLQIPETNITLTLVFSSTGQIMSE